MVRVSTSYGGVTFMALLDDDQGVKVKEMVARVTDGLNRFIESPDAKTTMAMVASLFQGALLPVSWRAFVQLCVSAGMPRCLNAFARGCPRRCSCAPEEMPARAQPHEKAGSGHALLAERDEPRPGPSDCQNARDDRLREGRPRDGDYS